MPLETRRGRRERERETRVSVVGVSDVARMMEGGQ
jgi:hypothetical protein